MGVGNDPDLVPGYTTYKGLVLLRLRQTLGREVPEGVSEVEIPECSLLSFRRDSSLPSSHVPPRPTVAPRTRV